MTAVVFDLDGTLIDSLRDIHRAANVALRAEHRAPLPVGLVRSFIGEGVAVLIGRTMTAAGLQGDATHARMCARFQAEYNRAPTAMTRRVDNAGRALENLRQNGHRLAICTNKPEATTRAILANLNLAQCFGAIIAGDTMAQRKPDPRPLQAAIRQLGATQGLFVGDSEVDAATACAAGVPFLLFTQGYRKAAVEDIPHTASFDDFAMLPGLVARHAPTVQD